MRHFLQDGQRCEEEEEQLQPAQQDVDDDQIEVEEAAEEEQRHPDREEVCAERIELRYIRPLGLEDSSLPPIARSLSAGRTRMSPRAESPPKMKNMPCPRPKQTQKLGKTKKAYNLDYNVYATKKNIAQGLIDIALLTANASQLKYLLTMGAPAAPEYAPAPGAFSIAALPWNYYFYWANLGAIGISVLLQVFIGVVLLFNTARHDVRRPGDGSRAECCNNLILTGVFFVTLVNVFIGVFINYEPADVGGGTLP